MALNLTFVNNKILRIKDRDVIIVEINNALRQPFYRSTGRHSGKKDQWLPFDGILCGFNGEPLWFIKNRFENKENPELNRYGTQQLKEVSELLFKMNILQIRDTHSTAAEVNEWIDKSIKIV